MGILDYRIGISILTLGVFSVMPSVAMGQNRFFRSPLTKEKPVEPKTVAADPPKETLAKQKPVAPKKNAAALQSTGRTAAKAPEKKVAETTATELTVSENAELQALKKEVESLKASLAASGVIESAAPLAPRLSKAAETKKARLEKEIAVKEEELSSFQKAVDGGLDPKLVKDNMDALRMQIATLREQVADVEASAEVPENRSLMQDQMAAQTAEIETLKTELAAVKAERAAENAKQAEESKENADAEKSFVEEMGELLPIELFAFGDFYFVYRETGEEGFEIGQLELDLSQELGAHLSVSVGVAFDGEHFGVGAFTIDGRLAGKEEGHLFHSEKIETSGILFGQFDVPFGIDYLEYASVDNPLVTGPLAVEETHGAWNDMGGQFYLSASRFNGVFFVVNGPGYETLIPEADLNPVSEETTIPHDTKIAVGTRLGVKPLEALELGGSFAGAFAEDIGLDVILAGGDVSLGAAGFSLKGEYIFHYLGVNSKLSARNHGFYATAEYEFNRFFAVGRYSMYFPEKNNPDFSLENDPLKQLSVGFGVKVLENASVRIEYSSDLLRGGSLAFIQLVGGTAWQPTGLRR